MDHEEAPDLIRKGMPKYRIPVVVLARLAVDQRFRPPHMTVHLGTGLLKDAFIRAARAASNVGMKAMMVNAIDDAARGFYEKYGFAQSPTDPLQLFLPMSVIRASIEAAATLNAK